MILFSALTVVRSKVWENGVTLWSDVLSKYPKNGRALSSIGLVYSQKGDYKKALEYYKKTLDIDLKIYDEIHPYIAADYCNVGLALNKIGDYDNALKYNEKALDIRLKLYGEEHPDVAEAYINLGETFYDPG